MADDTDPELLSQQALSDMARLRPVLDKIADKWTIMILTVLCPKPSRFNAIKRRLDGITHKALADALKRLERNGLVTRTVLPTAPIGVEYAITPLGHSLRQPFEALCAWAFAYGDAIEKASAAHDRASSRGVAHPPNA
ncbi:winged helix-turn-helix transcriptional regulator [Lichenifustis flavocetrariae]|uniref:Helix-turn-helix transcriptional regulator n=1 Tax=Lichenifustis flavocetrariae TaxID=2949735 RepID=A0AA41YRR8_9HYPH|nr:helix-turn-helix domain-containing protein [Lichenifustis flavocetrariae]MCW6507364.1 helix-turn-helix transcriptional regulator [Lichenifustis flavocetrariae]